MVKIILIFSLLVNCSVVFSQNAYYDALYLSEHGGIDTKDGFFNIYEDSEMIFPILDRYIEPNKRNSKREIFLALAENPYLKLGSSKSYSSSIGKYNEWEDPFTEDSIRRSDITFWEANLGKYNFSNSQVIAKPPIADVFSKVLIYPQVISYLQTKIEFSQRHLTFLKIFRNDFEIDTSLKILFPKTTNLLNLLDEDVIEINSYYNHLRVAFHEDFTSLNSTIQLMINSSYFDEQLMKRKDYRVTKSSLLHSLKSGFYLTKILAYNNNPADVFSSLVNNNLEDTLIKEVFSTIGHLSTSLRSTNKNSLWINEIELKNLLSSDNQFHIYLGLLYEQIKPSYHKNGTFFLKKYPNNVLADIKSKLFDIIHKKQGVEQFYYDAYLADSNSYERRREYFFRMTEVVNDYFELLQAINPEYKYEQYFSSYITFSTYFNNIYLSTNAKNYLEASTLIASLLNDPLIESTSSEDAAKSILKYGGFMSAFVAAQSPSAIDEVLERYVFPIRVPKSYKQRSVFDFGINSYIGLFSGYQLHGDSLSYRVSAGTTLPVGLNFSFAVSKDYRKKLSVFLPIMDVGALNVFNFKKDTIVFSEFRLSNIFSPGVHLVYKNSSKLPLTIMVGLQKSPSTFLDKTYRQEVIDGAFRLRIAVTFDLPIYTFYAKHVYQ